MSQLFPNVVWEQIFTALGETIYMTLIAALFAFMLGMILGIILFLTSEGKFRGQKWLYMLISAVVDICRSIPFIILIVLLIPVTKLIFQTIIGENGALPALIVGSVPFYSRLVELSLKEVDKGVIEAASAMGASKLQIIVKVLIPEALPALISSLTLTTVSLVGFSAMAGVVGAGGLGKLAYVIGYQRNQMDVVWVATLFIVLLVFIVQFSGNFISKKIDKR